MEKTEKSYFYITEKITLSALNTSMSLTDIYQ